MADVFDQVSSGQQPNSQQPNPQMQQPNPQAAQQPKGDVFDQVASGQDQQQAAATPPSLWNQTKQFVSDIPVGAGKAIAQTAELPAKAIHALGVPYNQPESNIQSRWQQAGTTNSSGEQTGKIGEGIAEFVMGDEALKGIGIAAKLGLAQKIAKIAEEYPTIAKALHIGMSSLRTTAVGTAQGVAHGQSLPEAAQGGAVAGATGGLIEGAAAGVKALAPGVKEIAGESIPVRASQNSGAANAIEHVTPSKDLQKFDVEQTQPAAKRAIGNVATEVKNAANANMAPMDAEAAINKLRNVSNKATDLRDAANQIKAQSKPVFEKLDALTKEDADLQALRDKLTGSPEKPSLVFSDFQKMEKGAIARGDMEAANSARAMQESLIKKYANHFGPDDLQNARANWRQANALEDVHDALNNKSVVEPTPVKLRAAGTPDPGYINGKNFSKTVLKLSNDGTLKNAGLTPEHIQSLQDLGRLLEKSGDVKKVGKLGMAAHTISDPVIAGLAHSAGIPFPALGVAGATSIAASKILSMAMTNPKFAAGLAKALQGAGKVAPGAAASIYRGASGPLSGND